MEQMEKLLNLSNRQNDTKDILIASRYLRCAAT